MNGHQTYEQHTLSFFLMKLLQLLLFNWLLADDFLWLSKAQILAMFNKLFNFAMKINTVILF